MKSEKSKKILAFVLCMVLMLTTSMSTMAEGGLIAAKRPDRPFRASTARCGPCRCKAARPARGTGRSRKSG